MASFVLVHGAWGGATLWRSFAPLLREKGHEVFFTSLTGLGERYHLGTAETNLSTHIQDVVELVEYENLRDITLVGHSYGGMVITGVADRIPDRIAHLVYLDAFLPRDGQALFDVHRHAAGSAAASGARVSRPARGDVRGEGQALGAAGAAGVHADVRQGRPRDDARDAARAAHRHVLGGGGARARRPGLALRGAAGEPRSVHGAADDGRGSLARHRQPAATASFRAAGAVASQAGWRRRGAT